MKRTELREMTMKLIFEVDAQNEFTDKMKEKFIENNNELSSKIEYIDDIYNNFINNKEKVDEMINDASENWKINRMNKVDLAICRLAVTEILYLDEIPNSVTINEAVNMAKKFGTEHSGKFVNGVLGQVHRKIENL